MLSLPPALDPLPDSARLWLLALSASPSPEVRTRLLEGMGALLGQWRHKGHAYRGTCALLENRILAVAEPDLASAPSGCAIDGMLRKVDRILDDLELEALDPTTHVLLRTSRGLQALPKADLGGLLAGGTLGAEATLLDLALYSMGDLRAGRLESPLARTWIGRKFSLTGSIPPESGGNGAGESDPFGPDMNEGGPRGGYAPSPSPLALPHVVAGQSPAPTSDGNPGAQVPPKGLA